MDGFVQVFTATWTSFATWSEEMGPKLLAALIILIVGWIVAKLVRAGLVRGLKLVKLDVVAKQTGIEDFLRRGNIKFTSVEVLGNLVYWLLLLLTLLTAVNAMGLSEARGVFDSVIGIIPGVILAVVILILGLSFASFVADVVQTASVNAQVRHARVLGNVSRYAITLLVAIVALNQLALDTAIIGQAVLILFAAVCFSAALAFGLGCRDLAGRIAEDIWANEQAASKALDDASAPEAEAEAVASASQP